MPELAEVECARRDLERWWVGRAASRAIVHDAKVSRSAPAALEAALTATCAAARRRGKYLIVDLVGGERSVVFHFRMTGKIALSEQERRRFTRVSWLVDEAGWLVFDDARRFGRVELAEGDPLVEVAALAAMGPEPHDLEGGAHLLARLGRTRRLLRDALLDQKVIAGVGNIAIAELFWRLGVPPDVRSPELGLERADALVRAMPAYFDALVAHHEGAEIDYLSEHRRNDDHPFDVYAREGEACRRCNAAIERRVFGARSAYFCPVCQAS